MEDYRPGWHQRLALTRIPRQFVRSLFFRIAQSAANTDDGRRILTTTLDDLIAWRPPIEASNRRCPYDDLGGACPSEMRQSQRPVFITARFRSGSTLLWNLFRHVSGCTAYYEPFNERRWFDPARRGTAVDPTHRNIDQYWREYNGLTDLGRFYREDWIRRRLYMDEASWDPDMRAYVQILIERAADRPVLQFNQVDFRLAWLRHMFPDAYLVHLYRHPRDQWCSSLMGQHSCPLESSLRAFAEHDHFYLRAFGDDLRHRFPFLDARHINHPYELFYYIWKLSYLFGIAYADCSISFEQLIAEPESTMRNVLDAVGIVDADVAPLVSLVGPAPSRWRGYADDAWFRRHEERCERVLREFLQPPQPRPGRTIDVSYLSSAS